MKKSYSISFLSFSFFLITLTSCKKVTQNSSEIFVGGSSECGASAIRTLAKGEVPSRQMIIEHAKVTPDEVAAINRYTSDTFASSFMRDSLQCAKKGDPSDFCFFGTDYGKLGSQFASGIQKISNSIPYKGKVYRGIIITEEQRRELKGKVGQELGLGLKGSQAYTSSSRNLEFAKWWINNIKKAKISDTLGSGPEFLGLIYSIEQCRGAAIENIEPPARGDKQKEVVLPPSKYRFNSSRMEGGTMFLELIEVGCAGLSLVGNAAPTLNLENEADKDLALDLELIQAIADPSIASEQDLHDLSEKDDHIRHSGPDLDQLLPNVDPEILKFFEPLPTNFSNGFALAEFCSPKIDEKSRQNSYNQTKKLMAYQKWLDGIQKNINANPDINRKNELVRSYQKVQSRAMSVVSEFSDSIKMVKFGSKISAVAGAAAQVVGWALGIAEAVDIKKNCHSGNCDAKAAEAVLSGMGIAGAIPAVLACDNCNAQQKAAAFFKGFFGIDFTAEAKCAPGFEPVGSYICRKQGCKPGYTDLAATCHLPAKIITSHFTGADCRGDICGLTTGRGCRACPADDGINWQFDGCTCRRDPISYSKEIYGSKP